MKTPLIIVVLLLTAGILHTQPPVPGVGPAARIDRGRAMLDGQKAKSEPSVLRALGWFQKCQNADGSWGDTNKGAMTGFALLSFLSHGETPESKEYGAAINKAVDWIITNGTKFDGRLSMAAKFSQSGVYEHGICTYALCEYYTMTKDELVVPVLKKAVGYIVEGQGPNGGWMYAYDKSADDLSVSGWQIQALKAAKLTALDIPGLGEALNRTEKFMETMKGPHGGYGYRGPGDKYSLTGAGIFCNLLWHGERGVLRKGMEWLLDETEKNKPVKYQGENADLYAWYYHTRACLFFGGLAWTKWRLWFEDEIVNAQNADGSWPATNGNGIGPQKMPGGIGPVYRTALCTLMLSAQYRCLPTLQGP